MECVANITEFLFVSWNVGDAWPCLFLIYIERHIVKNISEIGLDVLQ